MCAVTKVAKASGLVTAMLSQLTYTISIVKNNYTERKGAQVTILTCIKQKQNKEEKKGTSAIGLISQKNNILHFADNCAQN